MFQFDISLSSFKPRSVRERDKKYKYKSRLYPLFRSPDKKLKNKLKEPPYAAALVSIEIFT